MMEETIMKRDSNGMVAGIAILCGVGLLFFIAWIINLSTPKCLIKGCDNDAKKGSSYCTLHDNKTYKNGSDDDYATGVDDAMEGEEDDW